MDIRKLQRAIVDGLEDVKAQRIQVFNTEHLSPLFERVIVASGASNRQTKALASSVRETVKARGLPVLRTEGEENGEWIIVDCGAAVVHIMQPSIRDYYRLEELWGDKPVRMKLGAGPKPARAAGDAAAAASPRGRAAPPPAEAPAGAKRSTAAAGGGQDARAPARRAPVGKRATAVKRAPAAAKQAGGAKTAASAKKAAAAKKAGAPARGPKRQSGPARQPAAAKRGGQPPRRRA